MTEVTQETFKEAALEAGARLRGEDPPEKKKDKKKPKGEDEIRDIIRDRIREILREGKEEDFVRRVSAKTAARIAEAIWPERNLEVKKALAQTGVEQEALRLYIREIFEEDA